MKPLDLSDRPPRAPRERLAGVTFVPRSIDKVRATLPGGQPGDYRIEGLTRTMLDMLDVPLDTFVATVRAAAHDDDVASYLRSRVDPSACERWNDFVAAREPRGGNRAEALEAYPWLAQRPDMILVLDVLEEDDRRSFAAQPQQ